MSDIFYFFRQSPLRRDLVQGRNTQPGADYALYGLNHLGDHALSSAHNLSLTERDDTPQKRLAHWLGFLLDHTGGLSGDFQTVFDHRREAGRSRVILSTVDTVGIPLATLNALHLLRAPLVYISVGLPERIGRLRNPLWRRLYRSMYRRIPRLIAFGWQEAHWIRNWLGLPSDSPRVVFIPFGVDTGAFHPGPGTLPATDVLSIGADPRRDFETLFAVARNHPAVTFRLIVDKVWAAALPAPPLNIDLRIDVPFALLRDHLASARVVALPVHENTYSAGTTTLLQAMATECAVVVSRTGAVRDGYGLQDRVNCRLVEPGQPQAFEEAVLETLTSPQQALEMGRMARQTVCDNLDWRRFESRLVSVLKETMR